VWLTSYHQQQQIPEYATRFFATLPEVIHFFICLNQIHAIIRRRAILLEIELSALSLYVEVMIRFFLLQNKQGKTRLSKWYATAPIEIERIRLETEVHNIVSLRLKGNTNFVEVELYCEREMNLFGSQVPLFRR
jgi:Clathrin adaptor complex small chain